jgi:transcriptional regulator of acetoin/glycerol metabolism
MEALVRWSWPGNVRELENFVERSVILSPGSVLRAPVAELRDDAPDTGGNSRLDSVERDHILRIYRQTGGVTSAAAHRLGVPRATLTAMMKRFGISSSDL